MCIIFYRYSFCRPERRPVEGNYSNPRKYYSKDCVAERERQGRQLMACRGTSKLADAGFRILMHWIWCDISLDCYKCQESSKPLGQVEDEIMKTGAQFFGEELLKWLVHCTIHISHNDLPEFLSAALASIDDATASPHSSALQSKNSFCVILLKVKGTAH